MVSMLLLYRDHEDTYMSPFECTVIFEWHIRTRREWHTPSSPSLHSPILHQLALNHYGSRNLTKRGTPGTHYMDAPSPLRPHPDLATQARSCSFWDHPIWLQALIHTCAWPCMPTPCPSLVYPSPAPFPRPCALVHPCLCPLCAMPQASWALFHGCA